MIWVERKDECIIFYTADGLLFNNITSAISHIKSNMNELMELSESFDKMISRNKKIKKLTSGF